MGEDVVATYNVGTHTIETNADGEVVGTTEPELICLQIREVVQYAIRKNKRIRKTGTVPRRAEYSKTPWGEPKHSRR